MEKDPLENSEKVECFGEFWNFGDVHANFLHHAEEKLLRILQKNADAHPGAEEM